MARHFVMRRSARMRDTGEEFTFKVELNIDDLYRAAGKAFKSRGKKKILGPLHIIIEEKVGA